MFVGERALPSYSSYTDRYYNILHMKYCVFEFATIGVSLLSTILAGLAIGEQYQVAVGPAQKNIGR